MAEGASFTAAEPTDVLGVGGGMPVLVVVLVRLVSGGNTVRRFAVGV